MAQDSCQLISKDGKFNSVGLQDFVDSIKLHQCRLSYAVVAIIGPKTSGKSTLLNHLFYTKFKEMDALKGRSQTTKGIWMAKAVGIDPFTITIDTEGTDGREMTEDGTTFEKQSSLFALAVADIVLINMWCHDIGRGRASNKSLFKHVFQVMVGLFSPRKTTLLFVLRDKTKTPFECLELILRENIQKIWDSFPKPNAHEDAPLSDFFNVEVTALSSYEENEEQFKEQVAQLRQRFFHSLSPGGLAGDRRVVVPASEFAFNAEQIWNAIKDPARNDMVATDLSKEIADEKFNLSKSDKDRLAVEQAVQTGDTSDSEKCISTILEEYQSEYGMESIYFEEGIEQDASEVHEELYCDIEAHASHVCNEKLSDVVAKYEKQISEKLVEPLDELFEAAGYDTWASIRHLLRRESSIAASDFSSAIAGYDLDQATIDNMVSNLKDHAVRLVWNKSRVHAGGVLTRMKDRFVAVFNRDKKFLSMARRGRDTTMEAHCESLKLLSTMAAVRLVEREDSIEHVLFSELIDNQITDINPLASNTWEELPPENTLIKPFECKVMWDKFLMETDPMVTKAILAEEAYKRAIDWLPPPWAILGMIVGVGLVRVKNLFEARRH